MKISIIIPVFRGGEIISDLFLKITETLAGKYEYEVLFICDDCDYKSLEVITGLKNKDSKHIRVFRFAKNYGQHRAIQFGFGEATGDFIITMDEDMQHDPADILLLIEKQKEGNYDIVYAKFNELQHEGNRNRVSSILRKILKHFIPTLYDNYSPYRLIKREMAIRTSTMVCPYTFIDDFLSRVTQNIAFEEINHYKRMEGKSSYTFIKLCKHGLYILLAYSKAIPLMLAFSGLLVVSAAIMFTLSFISPGNMNNALFKYTTIINTLGIGVIFIFLSFIGSYINHRNSKVNTRPIILINEGSF